MSKAASTHDWTRVLRLGMAFAHLHETRWAPFLEANHPEKPDELLLACKAPFVAVSIRKCCHLFLTAYRLASKAQKQ